MGDVIAGVNAMCDYQLFFLFLCLIMINFCQYSSVFECVLHGWQIRFNLSTAGVYRVSLWTLNINVLA